MCEDVMVVNGLQIGKKSEKLLLFPHSLRDMREVSMDRKPTCVKSVGNPLPIIRTCMAHENSHWRKTLWVWEECEEASDIPLYPWLDT